MFCRCSHINIQACLGFIAINSPARRRGTSHLCFCQAIYVVCPYFAFHASMLCPSCEHRAVTGAHAGISELPLNLLAQVKLAAMGSVGGSKPSWFARPPWGSCDDLGADTHTLLQFGNYASKKLLAWSASAFSCTSESNLFIAFVTQPRGGFHQHTRLSCVLNYLSGKREERKKNKRRGEKRALFDSSSALYLLR